MSHSRWLLLLVTSCGVLPLIGSQDGGDIDGGDETSDVAVDGVDESSADASDVVVGADASDALVPIDATVDAIGDAGVEQDAGDVDAASDASVALDASTAPWTVTLGNGLLNAVAVNANQHILVGGGVGFSPQGFFVAELDDTGSTIWSHKVTGTNTFLPYQAFDVALDSQGNAYAVGTVGTALDFGAGAIGPGAVVVKYDSQGNFVWEYGAFGGAQFYGMRILSNDDLVLVGSLTGTENFGGGNLTSSGSSDAVVVEVSSSKTFVRAKAWGSTGDQYATAVAVDSADHVFVAGRFENAIDFGGGTMSGPQAGSGSFNTFVAKLDSGLGYMHQMNTQSQSNNDWLHRLSTDGSGNVLIAGTLFSTMNFGGGVLTSAGNGDIAVAKLDSSLGHMWSGQYGDSSGQNAFAVATDPLGQVAFAGFYSGTTNFGQGSLPANSGFFVAEFDAGGTSFASYGGPSSSAEAYGIAYLSGADFVVVGRCGGQTTFPTVVISCASNWDAFVTRMHP